MSNVASWMSFNDIVSTAAERVRNRGMQEIAFSVLAEYASEASREFLRRSEVMFETYQTPLIPSQRLYRLPQDCIRPSSVKILYPGDTRTKGLVPVNEKNLVYGQDRERTGLPSEWYYTKDRTSIGMAPVPTLGGFDGLTTAGSTTTATLETGASTDDDTYNDMTVTILSGSAQGQTTTVSDYVGSTKVVTFDDTLTASVGVGARIQIGKEQLEIEYQVAGNSYSIQKLESLVSTAVGTPRYNSIPITAGSYTPNYFKGCEVRFDQTTATTLLKGTKTRVLSSYGSVLTVYPELLTAPANGDIIMIDSVPNTPEPYHHYLVNYVVYMILAQIDRPAASAALTMFERGVGEAMRLLQPIQGDEYESLRGGYWDG